MRKIMAIILIFIIIGSIVSGPVNASETRRINGSVTFSHDTDFEPNMTFNLSDPSNSYLLNYNQTVQGFENESDITGAFTGSVLPPIEMLGAVNKNDIEVLKLCGQVRFKTEWIMSGSSESWWRVPERGPYYNDTVNLTLWNIGSPDLLNFTTDEPNSASHPNKIFDYSYFLNNTELNKTFRWYNTTAWNHTFNSTWVRVCAPIHGDEFYAFRWEIGNDSTWAEHWLRFSQNDIGDDKAFTTWIFYPNDTYDFLEADLDISVIHVAGHGYSVWGGEFEPQIEYDYFEDWENTGLDEGDSIHGYDGWSVVTAGSSTGELDNSQSYIGNYSLLLYHDNTNDVSAIRSITINQDNTIFSFCFRKDTAYRAYIILRSGGSNKVYIKIHTGPNIYLYNGVDYELITNYVFNTWYKIDLEFNFTNNQHRMAVNNVWYDWINMLPCSNFDEMLINNQEAAIHSLWIDDINYYKIPTSRIHFTTELEDEITNGDYLTVMVPFFESVENSTNVWILVEVVESSWTAAFLVADNGPTDFGIKSWLYDVGTDGQTVNIEIWIQNISRKLWIYDTNTLGDPDWEWTMNRYYVENHEWAPTDYYFGGVPYCSVQITNGSWENTDPPPSFYLGGRPVGIESLMRKSQNGDDWRILFTIIEVAMRGTAALSFYMTGQWDRILPSLDMTAPFPLDAPWYLGKYFIPAAISIGGFVLGLYHKVWSALVWIYEGVVWIVKNAPWVIAGTLKVLTLFIIIPLWARFYLLIGGLIKFGWIMAKNGMVAASEFASEFWSNYIATSYVKKIVTRGR